MTGRDLRALPKVQSHLHLTGSMRPATLRELAARYGIPEPPPTTWDGSTVQTWSAFQSRYDAARAAVRSPADVARVVAEAADDDAAGGCGWLELQVDPTSYAPALGGLAGAVEAVLTAAETAPIPVGVVIASSWTRDGDHAERLARLAVRYAGTGVIGFGLSNDERGAGVDDFVPAFRIAREAGILRTPHAGFYTGAEHVRSCIELLDATRIGHGTSAATDPATLSLLTERGIALEICPTSYPPFGVHRSGDVPIKELLTAGVPVTLGSDDPLLFGTDLAGQYAYCRDLLGMSDEQVAAIARHGIETSAAPDAVRERLLAGVDAWLRES